MSLCFGITLSYSSTSFIVGREGIEKREKKKKMVDDDLVLVREDPKECEQIQSLKKIQLKEWSMVVIRDSPTHDDCSIFPPINHENLPISEQNEQHPLSPPSSSSSSSSPSSSSPPPNPFSSSSSLSSSPSDSTASDPQPAPPPSDSRMKRAGEVTRWIGVGLEVIRCKVFALVSSFRNYDATKGAFWSFSPVAAAAAVFWMLFMQARRRRRRMESKGRLMQAIKEKDEVGF